MQVSVVHPDALSREQLMGRRWIYADSDESIRSSVEHLLGCEHEAISPRDFQLFARSVRNQVIDTMDSKISDGYADDWILTPLHRNPFASDLFLHLIWVELLRQRPFAIEKVVVITGSLGFYRSLGVINGWHVECGFQSLRYFHLQHYVAFASAVRCFVGDFMRIMIRMILSRLIITKATLSKACGAAVVIESYLYDSDLSGGGQFQSTHIPGLVEWYRKNAIKCMLVVNVDGAKVVDFLGLYRKIALSKEVLLPFERIVTGGDLLRSVIDILIYLWRSVVGIRQQSQSPLGQMAQSDLYSNSLRGLYALLYKYLPKRLLAHGIKPTLLLDWFENQAFDRALALGVKAICSDVHHVAFRPYLATDMHTNLYTSIHQQESGACPKEHWVSGDGLRSMLQDTDPIARYRVVPALRYQHVWRGGVARTSLADKLTLAVLLSHSVPESISVLNHVFFDPDLSECFNVVIKAHKNVPINVLQEWCESNGVSVDAVRWEECNLPDVLKFADIVVSTGTGAALEAVCYGVPVVIIGRQSGLTMNPLVGIDQRMWAEVYSPQELFTVLRDWIHHHPLSITERVDLGIATREQYFCPVNDETMEAFRVCQE